MKFPEEVITITKKGKKEARILKDEGKFYIYFYVDPNSGRETEKKFKLLLSGLEKREFFMLPLKDGKYLLIPTEYQGERKVWDNGNIKIIY